MQDYLKLPSPTVEKVYQYALKSLTLDGAFSKLAWRTNSNC